MVLSDTIVENDSIILENLCKTASSSWVSGGTSAYMIYNIPYAKPLIKDHIYYFRCKYKYTTTNQRPTWCTIYIQDGMNNTSASVSNPTAGTEYTLSGYGTMKSGVSYTLTEGHVYNGNSGAISGVTAQIKEMVVYDVTNLYQLLLATATVSDISTLITWCNSNLEWKAPGVRYDVTVPDSTKIVLKTGGVQGTAVECDGMEWYSVSSAIRNNTYFDTGSGISVYNNNSNGTVTHTRVAAKDQGSPFYPEHPYVLKITTNGSASPNCGGFVATHTAAAGKIVIERFVAKVPKGYNVTMAYNSQGTGASVTYLTNRAGTGTWQEYAILYKCGTSGTFSSGGHIYLIPDTGYSATSVTWYLAYVNSCDITSDESLKNYTALNNKDVIKGNKIFSKYFNTVNIFPNGDGSTTSMTLPSGWTWDSADVPAGSKAKASITQPVSAGTGYDVGGRIAINPHQRYKISMWIKSKRDMSNFLVAIVPYIGNTTARHENVIYVNGTKTQLTADLVNGATQMTVSSNANWGDYSYGRAGFRSNYYKDSWNTLGSSHSAVEAGNIKGVSGSTIVQFKTAYAGSTIAAGTTVVESRAGGVYPYPIGKESHPTDNSWKYVEGYFGSANSQWDGRSSTNSWDGLPSDCTHIGLALNIYGNDGSVPIKYADIKIEELGTTDGERHMDIIQFKKFD